MDSVGTSRQWVLLAVATAGPRLLDEASSWLPVTPAAGRLTVSAVQHLLVALLMKVLDACCLGPVHAPEVCRVKWDNVTPFKARMH